MRTPATQILDGLGIAYEIRTYDEVEKTASEVAEKLSLPPGTVFKTLLVQSTRDYAFAVVPGPQELSLRRLARQWGKPSASMADPRDIQRITGYVRGSVSPIGARRNLPVFLDASAGPLTWIAVSAGARGAELLIAPTDLVEAAHAVLCPICTGE